MLRRRITIVALVCLVLSALLILLHLPIGTNSRVMAQGLGRDASQPDATAHQVFLPAVEKSTVALPSFLTEYPVSASPLHVAVESPGHIWFTLPDQNQIGRLVVTSPTQYQVSTYAVPTVNSEPYDLEYAAGIVWFTERMGNKIGRLVPATGTIDEFTIPTANSQPTGIVAVAGSPTQVWFTERSGNALGKLVVNSVADYTFTEYALPGSYLNAQPEDLYIVTTDIIWFTAPGVSRFARFRPSLWPSSSAFDFVFAGSGSLPWAIKVDSGGYPWLTDRTGNRIGMFFPQTISDMRWYPLPNASSDPFGLAIAQGFVWFTERGGNRIGRIDPSSHTLRELNLPSGSVPEGLAADTDGCIWIAERGRKDRKSVV